MNKILAMVSTTAMTLLPAAAAFADGGHVEGGAFHHGAYGWGGMILGPVMMIAVVAVVIALTVLLVRWITATTATPTGRLARDILEERFARGEIDADEFENRRRTLDA